MIQAQEKYIHGTAAEQLQYDVYEENKVLKAKKVQRSYNKAKFKAVCMVLLVFALAITVIYRYAQITELNYKIDKQVKRYNALKNENIRLRVEMQSRMDLNKVREIAETKLGMQKPDKYQVVTLRVPKTDFTKVAEKNTEAKDISGNSLAFVLDKLGKFTDLLY